MKLPEAGETKTLIEKYGKRIFEQTFTLPNGAESDFLLVGTTKGISPVIVLPLTKDREVVAVRQFRYGANAVVLELPGGCPKPGQSPEEVLFDELSEETGYRPESVVRLGEKVWFDPASVRVSYVPFLALGCVFEKEPEPDPFELIEVVRVPLGKWLSLVESGEVEDGKSVVVTCLAMRHLRTL